MALANVLFKNLVKNEEGCIISNAENEIMCIVEDSQGNIFEIYIPLESLKSCNLWNETENDCNLKVPQSPQENIEPHCQLWRSAKCQTANDKLATNVLLQLRKEYDNQFKDKKTTKNAIWSKIASKMNDMGFFVGDKLEGREKVRQKFSNLQTSYQKYLQKRQQIGEGAIEKPPYFDDLEKILGDTHKVCPPFVIDSEKPCESPKVMMKNNNETTSISKMPLANSELQPGCSKDCDTENTVKNTSSPLTTTPNRFKSVKKSVRPEKEKVVDVLKNMHQEALEQRKHEFTCLVNLLREENKQRHEEIMGVINFHKKKSDKRKRERSSSSSD